MFINNYSLIIKKAKINKNCINVYFLKSYNDKVVFINANFCRRNDTRQEKRG